MTALRRWLTDLGYDLRYALRTLRCSPFFTTVALVTLALGIGANTAVFSLLDLMILRDLPVRDPSRLVQFKWTYPGDPPLNLFSVDYYEHVRDDNAVFSDTLGTAPVRLESRAADGAETLGIECVTGNFFTALGVRSAAGRLFEHRDSRPGEPPVAVVSWTYWTRRFNRAPGILGTSLVLLGDVPVTVIGVTDHAFSGLVLGYAPDIWVPLSVCQRKGAPGLALMARLKTGVTIDRARAEMRALDRPRIETLAQRDPQWREVVLDVLPARAGLATPLHDQFAKPLLVLMAVLGVLLLLACVNIGGLLLARTAARQRDIAVRVSLGAGRLRIARQLLAESLLLAFAGGFLGIAGAYVGASALMRIMASGTRLIGVPPRLDVTIDVRALAFTTVVATLAALVFGLVPALVTFPSSPAKTLRECGGAGATPRRLFANGLVVAQVALAVALLSNSAVFIGHLSNLRNRSLGFDRTSVLLVSLDPASGGRSRTTLQQRDRELLTRFEAIPGVRSATLSATTPLAGGAASRFAAVEGFQEDPQARRRLMLNVVAPKYFGTFGTPIVAGRDFEFVETDASRVAIVNQAMARHYFAGRNPLGMHIRLEGDPRSYEIVGVVGDAKYADVRAAAPRTVYLHYFQQNGVRPEFALRTSVPPTSIVGDVRRVADDVLGAVRVTKVTTLAEQVDAAIVPERLIAVVSGFFGGIGLLLAAVGLFGLLAYTVARRRREIGVRRALGATERDVTLMVLKSALTLVGAGLIVGAPLAIWGARVAASVTENLRAEIVVSLSVAAAATIVLSLVAAYVPARRAASVDPIDTLRSE